MPLSEPEPTEPEQVGNVSPILDMGGDGEKAMLIRAEGPAVVVEPEVPEYPRPKPLPLRDDDIDKQIDYKVFQHTFANIGAYLDKHNERLDSPAMQIGGSSFSLMVYPGGNCKPGVVSVFLLMNELQSMQLGQKVFVHFRVFIESRTDPRWELAKESKHVYKRHALNWGFHDLITHDELMDPSRGYIDNNGGLTINCEVRIVEGASIDHWGLDADYDSYRKTGMVGLRNLGATCYMNSVLQALFYTHALRRAVFEMPTQEEERAQDSKNEEPKRSVALGIQRVFYRLQTGEDAADTNELTKSFGWTTMDAFQQHDVQEFLRVLMDKIEEKMKSSGVTQLEGLIERIFRAKMKSYIKCTEVEYESSRPEDYYDIQLKVKGVKSLVDSFRDYCEVEQLDGDNKYMAEGHGLQPAKKGIIFTSFPPVLHLQLRRFEYDMERDESCKVHDRFEFPEQINLDEFLEEPDTDAPANYTLQSVLVQGGDACGGHYIAFIRPNLAGDATKWFKFDDDTVTRCKREAAIDDNFGGQSHTSAYMLVYVRDSDAAELLRPIPKNEVPEHLASRFAQEIKDKEALLAKAQEAARWCEINVIRESDFLHSQGVDIVNKRLVKNGKLGVMVQVLRETSNANLYQTIKLHFDKVALNSEKIETGTMALYQFNMNRRDVSNRLDAPLDPAGVDNLTLPIRKNPTCFFLSESHSSNFSPFKKQEDCLIFVKFFYQRQYQLINVMATPFSSTATIIDIELELRKRMDSIDEAQELLCFEEEDKVTISPVKPKDMTLDDLGIGNGNILVFQDAPPSLAMDPVLEEYPDEDPEWHSVKDYYLDLNAEMMVTLIDYGHAAVNTDGENESTDTDEKLNVPMDLRWSYWEVCKAIARELNTRISKYDVHPEKLQLFRFDNFGGAVPISSKSELTLGSMLIHGELHFRKLDTSITLQENFISLKNLFWLDQQTAPGMRLVKVEVPISKGMNPEDLLNALWNTESLAEVKKAYEITDKSTKDFRLICTNDSMIKSYKHFSMDKSNLYLLDESSEVVNRYGELQIHTWETVRFEEVPEYELPFDHNGASFVQVYHVDKWDTRRHGVPFCFSVVDDETVTEFRERLRQALGEDPAEFDTWKVGIAENHKIDLLEAQDENGKDNYMHSADFETTTMFFTKCIVLDHAAKDKGGSKSAARRSPYGSSKALKIHN